MRFTRAFDAFIYGVAAARQELESMREEKQNTLRCSYCNKAYELSDQDFTAIIAQAR